MDRIWGIGLAEDDRRAWNKKSWRGQNLLGEVLTKVRDKLMGMDAKTAQVVDPITAQVAVEKTTQLLSPQQHKLMGSNPGPANPPEPEKGAVQDNE